MNTERTCYGDAYGLSGLSRVAFVVMRPMSACRVMLAAAVLAASTLGAQVIPPERMVPWRPGVQGPIPERDTIFSNVREHIPGSSLVAVGDGIHDDTAALRAAISLCPAGQTVYIPEGRYVVTSSLEFKYKSEITIRGAGPDKTEILSSANELFKFGTREWNPPLSRIMKITGGSTRGADTITVDRIADHMAVDHLVLINQLNDPALVNRRGSTGSVSTADRDHDGTRNMAQLVKITAIDGHQIVFSPALYWDYSPEFDPEATFLRYRAYRVGFEDFKVTATTEGAQTAFMLSACDEFWIHNIELNRIARTGIFLSYCLRTEVKGCYFHHAFNDFYTVGTAYGINTAYGTALLFENNLFDHMRVPLHFNYGTSGSVAAYNYSINQRDSDPGMQLVTFVANHGAHTMMNLWEGNVGAALQADYFRGSSSHTTVFRNHLRGHDTTVNRNRKPISFDRFNRHNNVVGNVLGIPEITDWVYEPTENGYSYYVNAIYRLGYPHIGNNGFSSEPNLRDSFDPLVAATLLRHGNFDYATRDVVWDPQIAERQLPPSLYLDERPPWWGELPWPPIGPDREPMVGDIPAQVRFRALTAERPEVLVDNADVSGTVEIDGAWTASTHASDYWAFDYLHDGADGKDAKTVTFRPALPLHGAYEVAIRYPSEHSPNHPWSENVPVDIVDAGGLNTVMLNQRINGGQWVILATNMFAAGTDGFVRIRTTDTTGYVIADAMRWRYQDSQPATRPAPLLDLSDF